jgi:hypothetical protein
MMVVARPRGAFYADREQLSRCYFTELGLAVSIGRELLKTIPLGIVVPFTIMAASVSPEDAGSNFSKWLHWIGVHDLPYWVMPKITDDYVVVGAILLSVAYGLIVWGLIPYIQRHDKTSTGQLLRKTSHRAPSNGPRCEFLFGSSEPFQSIIRHSY